MIEAYKKFFTNYAKFDGCSSRADYWYVVLVNMLINFAISALTKATDLSFIAYLSWVYTLVTFVPGLALIARRMHDINKSGWAFLMILIPIAGPIIVLVYLLKDRVEPNNYGERI